MNNTAKSFVLVEMNSLPHQVRPGKTFTAMDTSGFPKEQDMQAATSFLPTQDTTSDFEELCFLHLPKTHSNNKSP